MKCLILLTGLLLSSHCLAQSQYEDFVCIDKSLKQVFISIEREADRYSLYTYNEEEKTLVDQGLECVFSIDGTQLFLCSKNSDGPGKVIQYFSESEVIESLMNSSKYTGFYKLQWEGDITKHKKLITSTDGVAKDQCAGK